ncbi:MAG: thiamine phosphate synthase [Candidatus Omnitrophota bacterium]|nr:thiamine phosphate synthase [Candidatus Omnitrophota bacterium]
MGKIKDHSLYLVISEECGKGKTALEIAAFAISGGVDIIQLREKNRSRNEIVKIGRELSGLCKDKGVIFIVNDDPAIAGEAGADGVHLGQEDIVRNPIKESRKILGEDRIIGISTHSIEQFKAANDENVDYIAFGPIFPTKTKDYFLGADGIEKVLSIAKKPVFFIGGIDLSNIGEVLGKGAKNIALIRGILEAEDITSQVKKFKRLLAMTLKGRT